MKKSIIILSIIVACLAIIYVVKHGDVAYEAKHYHQNINLLKVTTIQERVLIKETKRSYSLNIESHFAYPDVYETVNKRLIGYEKLQRANEKIEREVMYGNWRKENI